MLTIATSGSSTRTNYPKVVWFGDLANEGGSNNHGWGSGFDPGAQYRLRNFEREGEKAIYRQSIVGREISQAVSKIESAFGIKPERNLHIEDVNDVHLAGTVLHIFKVPDRDMGNFDGQDIYKRAC